jgi:hypothetical protein
VGAGIYRPSGEAIESFFLGWMVMEAGRVW